jgi:hypothetical protein
VPAQACRLLAQMLPALGFAKQGRQGRYGNSGIHFEFRYMKCIDEVLTLVMSAYVCHVVAPVGTEYVAINQRNHFQADIQHPLA